jgi:hypothetical protein
MRRRRMELAYVSLLPAVPKAWRATIALTQPLAVEPLRWVLRGVAAQCFVVNRIFRILLPTQLVTNPLLFRTIFAEIQHDFRPLQR